MIIRFNENLQVEEIDAEETINAGNNLVNEIKVFMPSNFDFNIHKGYINFKLSDGKEYNNLVMERVKKENIQLVQEMCYYYVLPKFLTKQKGTIDLSVRISPISNTNIIANTGVIKAEINYAVFENGDEVLDPDTAEELRKDISESESALKLYVQKTIEDGYDLRVIGTVDSINDLPKNLTFNDVGISYFVGITYPRDVYTWGYLNDMELGWSNQGPLKVLSDDPVLEFAKSEFDKQSNKLNILDKENTAVSGIEYSISKGVITINGTTNSDFGLNIPINTIPSGTYSYNDFRSTSNAILTGITDSNYNYIIYGQTENGGKQTTTTSSNGAFLRLWIDSNTTFNNFTISPMLITGTTIPSIYHEYKGEIIHEKDIKSVTLFNGRSNANITMTDNWQKYKRFTIFFEDKFYSKSSVIVEDNSLVCLSVTSIDTYDPNNWGYLNSVTIGYFENNTFKLNAYGRWYRYANGTAGVEKETSNIYITKILAYKEG